MVTVQGLLSGTSLKEAAEASLLPGENFGQFIWLRILLGRRNGYMLNYILRQVGGMVKGLEGI